MSSDDSFELISRAGERRILAENADWCVYELLSGEPSSDDGPCLVFESTKVVRRVRNYPLNWRELPEGELLRLKELT